ncbi:MAG: hypothetical protein MHMPM18_001716 [Marteilia pararefringens]
MPDLSECDHLIEKNKKRKKLGDMQVEDRAVASCEICGNNDQDLDHQRPELGATERFLPLRPILRQFKSELEKARSCGSQSGFRKKIQVTEKCEVLLQDAASELILFIATSALEKHNKNSGYRLRFEGLLKRCKELGFQKFIDQID